ncbi:MAG: hypothetical protein ABII64_02460 [Elusimicrobiota bacterium]
MEELFPETKENIGRTEKAFMEIPEVKRFIESWATDHKGKPIWTIKTRTRAKHELVMLGRAYGRADISGSCGIKEFLKEEHIRSAFGTIRKANTAMSCMKILRKLVKYLKNEKVLGDEYELPKIDYRKGNAAFEIDYAKKFDPNEHVKTKIMQFICLLAGELKLRTTQLVDLKTTGFDLKQKRLIDGKGEEYVLPKSICAFIEKYPDLLRRDKYLLSLDGKKISAKTLTRRFNKSLSSEFKGKIKLQTIASNAITAKQKSVLGKKEGKPAIWKPVQIELF